MFNPSPEDCIYIIVVNTIIFKQIISVFFCSSLYCPVNTEFFEYREEGFFIILKIEGNKKKVSHRLSVATHTGRRQTGWHGSSTKY